MDDVRLYHGDCLDIMRTLPDGEADMIFADPPFNAGKEYKGDMDDAKPVAEYYAWLDERLAQMEVIQTGGQPAGRCHHSHPVCHGKGIRVHPHCLSIDKTQYS